MTADARQKAARPHGELIRELLDSRIPKNEREHAAAREIEALREEVERVTRELIGATNRADKLAEALETCLETEERPEVIELAKTALAAASQLARDGCHCGTCTCDPNMTPAVRFDLSPAQHEGVIRDHLIRLGWTPPGEHAQQPAAPSKTINVVGMPEFDSLLDHIYEHGTAAEGVIEKANAFAQAVRNHLIRQGWTPPNEQAMSQPAAPSAEQTTGITATELGYALKRATPAQVIEYLEDDVNMHVALSIYFEELHNQQPNAGLDVEAVLRQFLTGDGYIAECDIKHIVAALAQQPATVDEAMVERACKAFLDEIWPNTYEDADDLRAMIRRVLSAALVDQPKGDK